MSELDLLNWTITRRPLLAPSIPFDLAHHAYLKGLYRPVEAYPGQSRHKCFKKSGQSGISELAMNEAFHTCDVRNGNVFWVMPTDGAVSDFSQSRFEPAIDVSPYLQSIVGKALDKKSAERVTLKKIRQRFLVMRSGHVGRDGNSSQLKSFVADKIIRDELDEMDKRVIPLTQKRYGHSLMKEEVDISTPTFPGVGIDEVWKVSDQREWYVPCPHCGRYSPLAINQVVTEWDDAVRPLTWNGMNEGRAWIACSRCGRELDRLAAGEWVAKHPGREVMGFHITKLFTYHNSVLSVVNNLRTNDEEKYREAMNQDLGEPYTPPGGHLTDEDLDACIEKARPSYVLANQSSVPTYLGMDVGESLHHVVIRGRPDETGQRRQYFAGEISSFDTVARLIRDFKVKSGVIDLRPQVDSVRNLQAAFPNILWLCEYKEDTNWPEAQVFHDEKDTDNDGLVFADRARTLDVTRSRFLGEYPENTLAQDIKTRKDYYIHMEALSRQMVPSGRKRGVKVLRFVGDKPDHFFHAENYCMMASLAPARKRATTVHTTKAKGWMPTGRGAKRK